jgi:predicted permease
MFRDHPAYMLGASALLAATVGLNVAVFAVVNALWLRPVPVKDPDRVVIISASLSGRWVPPYVATFESVAAQVATDRGLEPDLRFADAPRPLEVMGVTSGYFRLFGLQIRGRDFAEDDDREGAEPVAIISERLWSRAFGRRADIIGAVMAAHPLPIRIVGVAPRGFEGARRGERTDVWVPRALFPRVLRALPQAPSPVSIAGVPVVTTGGQSEPAQGSTTLPLTTWARLLPGDTIAEAERRVMETASSASVSSVSDVYGTPERRTVLIREDNAVRVVAGLAMLVLLGGCAALASLVLVHYERRRREFGVRAALGASTAKLVTFVARELTAIGAVGTVGALAVASLALRALPSLDLTLPAGIDLARLDVSLDWRVLLAGLAMTTMTLVLAAWLSIARVTQKRLAGEVLSGQATTASPASQRVRQGLLALLVGATAVVLVAAALFVRSVDRAFGHAAGFDVERTLFAAVPVNPPVTFRSYEFQGERARLVREALQAIPGVDGVAHGSAPIGESVANSVRESRPVRAGGQIHQLRVGLTGGSHDLLSTLGIPIVAGRGLTASDLAVRPVPTVVTESVARRLWPAESPLGQSLGDGYYIVVGVARDFAFGSLSHPADGVFVVPRDDRSVIARFVLRTARADAALVEEIRRVLKRTLPDAPTATVLTGREVLARDLGRQRLGAWFFSAFGLVALGVGAGSVFGLVAYLAESRRREFGVRLALGATPRGLVRYGVAAALVPVAIGLVSGLLVAVMVSRVFSALLVGVSAVDGFTYVLVATVLLGAATGAAMLAAWRLRAVSPLEALRSY